MAAIDEIPQEDLVRNLSAFEDINILRRKTLLRDFFWTWFNIHKDNKVITISLFKGLVKYPIRVSHLKPLFIQLFGEPIQT